MMSSRNKGSVSAVLVETRGETVVAQNSTETLNRRCKAKPECGDFNRETIRSAFFSVRSLFDFSTTSVIVLFMFE